MSNYNWQRTESVVVFKKHSVKRPTASGTGFISEDVFWAPENCMYATVKRDLQRSGPGPAGKDWVYWLKDAHGIILKEGGSTSEAGAKSAVMREVRKICERWEVEL